MPDPGPPRPPRATSPTGWSLGARPTGPTAAIRSAKWAWVACAACGSSCSGGGAREHALCRALAADPAVTALACAPGNAGTARPGRAARRRRRPTPTRWPRSPRPGAPTWSSSVPRPRWSPASPTRCARAGIDCFGPSAQAALLEGSKAFAKDVMAAAGVPTAMAHVVRHRRRGRRGAGRVRAAVRGQGRRAGRRQGRAGHRRPRRGAGARRRPAGAVVVEEYLDGPEVSLLCLTDGTTVVPLLPAQDFKRLGDGDTGPNTGGMGAYSPLPWAPFGLVDDVVERVVQPTVDELRPPRHAVRRGAVRRARADPARAPRVIEFNARFGDPETQVVLRPAAHAAGRRCCAPPPPARLERRRAAAVVRRRRGHRRGRGRRLPGDAAHRRPDRRPGRAPTRSRARTSCTPVRRVVDGGVVSAGGRVLSVVGTGADLEQARDRAYAAVGRASSSPAPSTAATSRRPPSPATVIVP